MYKKEKESGIYYIKKRLRVERKKINYELFERVSI